MTVALTEGIWRALPLLSGCSSTVHSLKTGRTLSGASWTPVARSRSSYCHSSTVKRVVRRTSCLAICSLPQSHFLLHKQAASREAGRSFPHFPAFDAFLLEVQRQLYATSCKSPLKVRCSSECNVPTKPCWRRLKLHAQVHSARLLPAGKRSGSCLLAQAICCRIGGANLWEWLLFAALSAIFLRSRSVRTRFHIFAQLQLDAVILI